MAAMSYAEKARLSNYEITEDSRGNEILIVRNAWMLYKNFAGDPAKNYKPGDHSRRFSLLLDEPVANDLKNLGWNVKKKDARNEDEDPYYITEVTVNLDCLYPPKFQLYTELNGQYNEPIDIDPVDFIKIDNGEIRIKAAEVVVSLAKTGGRYLQELRIYERPQRTGWLDGDYARKNAYRDDDEMPFEEE